MIRFTCDLCKREIDPEEDLRYVVKIEIYASLDPMVLEEDDRDHLQRTRLGVKTPRSSTSARIDDSRRSPLLISS